MEDAKFTHLHSHSPLPAAGNDPGDPLMEEEKSVPNPTSMEATENKEGMPDDDDLQAGLSDNESGLSDAPDDLPDEFEEEWAFDANNIAIEERAIDEDNVKQIGVHKRKRNAGEGEEPKKKKKRADKPRRKKNKDGDEGEGVADGERRSKRSKKATRVRGTSPEEAIDENLTPEERRKRALNAQMDAIVKSGSSRRRKKDGIDLEQMADQEIEEMRRRMAQAAMADNEGRKRNEPARHKLKLLPEVTALLNKNSLRDTIVDPEVNLLESVRFFLEPLSDGSLPAYDIQKELFASLARLPVNKDTLVASGIGKVIMFYIKSKRPELTIKRQAERLFTDWTRPILRRTDDYRKKEFAQADYDPTRVQAPNSMASSQAATQAAYRKKALEAPRAFQRARMETGPTTYTIAPKSNIVFNENTRNRSTNVDIMRQIKGGRGGGRR